MDYKNDNRTPRDRVTGEFLSELLFTESGSDCDCAPTFASGNFSEKTRNQSCRRNTVYNADRSCTVRRNTEPHRDCRCSEKAKYNGVGFTGNYSLAMAYVPMQDFEDLFELEEGFCEGTIFKSLRFPFYPTPCRKECD